MESILNINSIVSTLVVSDVGDLNVLSVKVPKLIGEMSQTKNCKNIPNNFSQSVSKTNKKCD